MYQDVTNSTHVHACRVMGYMAEVLEPFRDQPAPGPIKEVAEYLYALVHDAEDLVQTYQKRNCGIAFACMGNEAVRILSPQWHVNRAAT